MFDVWLYVCTCMIGSHTLEVMKALSPSTFTLYLNVRQGRVKYHGFIKKGEVRHRLGAYAAFQIGSMVVLGINIPIHLFFWQDLEEEVCLYVWLLYSCYMYVYIEHSCNCQRGLQSSHRSEKELK